MNFLKNARADDILHLVLFENLRKQILVLSPESRSVTEVGASQVFFPGRSFGPWPGIIGLMCGTLERVRGWKLLCVIFNSSQPRFGGNDISERNAGDFTFISRIPGTFLPIHLLLYLNLRGG